MAIKNISKKTVLCETHKVCRSFFSKAHGLMFSKNFFIPLVFIFAKEQIVPLHMWFVFFPIDVLFLDAHKHVVEIKEGFKPWTMYVPTAKAVFVIELPTGSIAKSKTSAGDILAF